jgi:demethylmenaquinone methyltransferase/2-methoxy-6-polyprenyl-1,4-benzoquinol methylase
METNDDLSVYYARRAEEYERIYEKPERQADLATLREALPRLLAHRDVLELACGTGYWTQHIATRARSVYATDINEEVLELARRKTYPRDLVRFARLDIYGEVAPPGNFDGGLAAFWWSHVPRQELEHFLGCFHRWLDPGALVVYLDNRHVPGSSTPLSRSDEAGNTYQLRSLDDGTHYEVLKNFPDEDQVTALLSGVGDSIEYRELDYFWYVSYRLAGS